MNQQLLNDSLIQAADGEPEWARRLLDAGAKPNGMALIMAIQCGEVEITRWYVEAGAPINELIRGTTPLIHAVTAGFPDVVAVLLEAGSDCSQPDAEGRTPLAWLRGGNLARNRPPGSYERIEGLLIAWEAKAD